MYKRDDIGFRIRRINNLMRQYANAHLKVYDLTLSQMKTLYYLNRKEEHTARLKELEKFFQVSQPSMAGIVVRLEEKGFVKSLNDPEDKRVKLLKITEEGEKVCRDSYESSITMENEILAGLGNENANELKRLLDLLYDTIAKEVEDD